MVRKYTIDGDEVKLWWITWDISFNWVAIFQIWETRKRVILIWICLQYLI